MTDINPEIFERAAERIERTGMTKGAYYKVHGDEDYVEYPLEVGEHIRETDAKCCVLGALAAEALVGDHDAKDVVEQYARFFASTLGLTNWDLPEWNDAPSRRKGDLVRAFRRAAAKAREGQ